MGMVRRLCVLFIAFTLGVYVLVPLPRTSADGHISQFHIINGGAALIAGNPYSFSYTVEKAPSTFYSPHLQYSTSNGLTWNDLWPDDNGFILPIDPQLTSAIFRLSAKFTPLIGSDSYSEQTIGPYAILQPGSASDFTASANENGSVTLNWTDNSNMESYYQITRDGPDGSKQFYLENTTNHIGQLQYVDNSTQKYLSTIYAYSVLPIIDQYSLSDNNPGTVSALTKTIAQVKVKDTIDIITEIPRITENYEIKVEYELEFSNKWGKYVLDMDQTPVSGLELGPLAVKLDVGNMRALTATVIPAIAWNKKVVWSSDNLLVATVDSAGNVTGVAPGMAKITARTESGGFTGVSIVTVTREMGELQPIPAIPAIVFADTGDHWASKYISEAAAIGFVNGYPDGSFRPDAGITRAEFASMLIKGLNPILMDGVTTPLTFKDKNKIGAWAVTSVEQAVALGIISGYTDGTFRPQANITHSEMISMVVRASGIAVGAAQPTHFTDDADIPKWARAAVSAAEKSGIIIVGGLTDNKFAPQARSTRAEAAAVIVEMLSMGH